MSLTKQVDVHCPSCGGSQKFTMWESLNVEINPAEKENLLSGEICTLSCNSCGEQSSVEYDLLYHDPGKKLMVQLRYDDGDKEGSFGKASDLLEVLGQDYRLRLVSSFRQLVEKVLIYDDGLDDRVVEVLKSQSWRQVMDLLPESEPQSDEIYYQELVDTSDGGKQLILAVITEDDLYPVSVPHRAGYLHTLGLLLNSFAAHADEKSRWLAVDRAYADRIIAETSSGRWIKPRSSPSEPLPSGAVRWLDQDGQVNHAPAPPGWLQEALRIGRCKLVYRVLIKDPIYQRVQEDFWELADDQVKKFVDAEGTAYCAISYVRGEQKILLVAKPVWKALSGWQDQ